MVPRFVPVIDLKVYTSIKKRSILNAYHPPYLDCQTLKIVYLVVRVTERGH